MQTSGQTRDFSCSSREKAGSSSFLSVSKNRGKQTGGKWWNKGAHRERHARERCLCEKIREKRIPNPDFTSNEEKMKKRGITEEFEDADKNISLPHVKLLLPPLKSDCCCFNADGTLVVIAVLLLLLLGLLLYARCCASLGKVV